MNKDDYKVNGLRSPSVDLRSYLLLQGKAGKVYSSAGFMNADSSLEKDIEEFHERFEHYGPVKRKISEFLEDAEK